MLSLEDNLLGRYVADFEPTGRPISEWPEQQILMDLVAVKRFLIFFVFIFMKAFDGSRLDEDPENFYMEREWRIVGNLQFTLRDVSRVLIPSAYARRFKEELPNYFGQLSFVE